MTKEEILSKSRCENKNIDMVDVNAQLNASRVALYGCLGICSLISALSWFFLGSVCVEVWCIFFGTESVAFFVKFIMVHKKHELFVFLCYLLLFGLTLVCFIGKIMRAA